MKLLYELRITDKQAVKLDKALVAKELSNLLEQSGGITTLITTKEYYIGFEKCKKITYQILY